MASQDHEEENRTQNDHRRSTQDDGTTARWWQAMAAGWLNSDSSVVAPAVTDHCDRLRSIANQASNCLHCPGPGDENVGPLALATTDFLTVAMERADHPGVATIPTMGTKDEGVPALTDGDLPTAGNRCCYPEGTGCPANDSSQATHSPDCLLQHSARPGTEPYGQLTTHGWRNFRRTSCLAPANPDGAAPSCSGYR